VSEKNEGLKRAAAHIAEYRVKAGLGVVNGHIDTGKTVSEAIASKALLSTIKDL
jgi:hypothetical protein